MSKQPDFQGQRGRLREEVEATGNLVIFYPKFYREMNLIKRFWCAAKYYARENCEYNLKGLCETVSKALDSVTVSAIFHYYQHSMRIMDAYRSKLEYGTKQFTEAVYRGHREVVDKSKW